MSQTNPVTLTNWREEHLLLMLRYAERVGTSHAIPARERLEEFIDQLLRLQREKDQKEVIGILDNMIEKKTFGSLDSHWNLALEKAKQQILKPSHD